VGLTTRNGAHGSRLRRRSEGIVRRSVKRCIVASGSTLECVFFIHKYRVRAASGGCPRVRLRAAALIAPRRPRPFPPPAAGEANASGGTGFPGGTCALRAPGHGCRAFRPARGLDRPAAAHLRGREQQRGAVAHGCVILRVDAELQAAPGHVRLSRGGRRERAGSAAGRAAAPCSGRRAPRRGIAACCTARWPARRGRQGRRRY
jgi:hypothetical protein